MIIIRVEQCGVSWSAWTWSTNSRGFLEAKKARVRHFGSLSVGPWQPNTSAQVGTRYAKPGSLTSELWTYHSGESYLPR